MLTFDLRLIPIWKLHIMCERYLLILNALRINHSTYSSNFMYKTSSTVSLLDFEQYIKANRSLGLHLADKIRTVAVATVCFDFHRIKSRLAHDSHVKIVQFSCFQMDADTSQAAKSNDRFFCLVCENTELDISSLQRHFETKHGVSNLLSTSATQVESFFLVMGCSFLSPPQRFRQLCRQEDYQAAMRILAIKVDPFMAASFVEGQS